MLIKNKIIASTQQPTCTHKLRKYSKKNENAHILDKKVSLINMSIVSLELQDPLDKQFYTQRTLNNNKKEDKPLSLSSRGFINKKMNENNLKMQMDLKLLQTYSSQKSPKFYVGDRFLTQACEEIIRKPSSFFSFSQKKYNKESPKKNKIVSISPFCSKIFRLYNSQFAVEKEVKYPSFKQKLEADPKSSRRRMTFIDFTSKRRLKDDGKRLCAKIKKNDAFEVSPWKQEISIIKT